jgi:hypothetical protein
VIVKGPTGWNGTPSSEISNVEFDSEEAKTNWAAVSNEGLLGPETMDVSGGVRSGMTVRTRLSGGRTVADVAGPVHVALPA